MPRDIPAACDGYGKKLSVDHALSWNCKGLILAQHDDAAKEWVKLGAQTQTPSEIS